MPRPPLHLRRMERKALSPSVTGPAPPHTTERQCGARGTLEGGSGRALGSPGRPWVPHRYSCNDSSSRRPGVRPGPPACRAGLPPCGAPLTSPGAAPRTPGSSCPTTGQPRSWGRLLPVPALPKAGPGQGELWGQEPATWRGRGLVRSICGSDWARAPAGGIPASLHRCEPASGCHSHSGPGRRPSSFLQTDMGPSHPRAEPRACPTAPSSPQDAGGALRSLQPLV